MKYYGNLVLISTLFFAFFACGDSEEVVVDSEKTSLEFIIVKKSISVDKSTPMRLKLK